MLKIRMLGGALALIVLLGFCTLEQRDTIKDLREQEAITQVVRENEIKHFDRESERLDALNELRAKQGVLRNEASKDTSDSNGTFGVSRVLRLNQIR